MAMYLIIDGKLWDLQNLIFDWIYKYNDYISVFFGNLSVNYVSNVTYYSKNNFDYWIIEWVFNDFHTSNYVNKIKI